MDRTEMIALVESYFLAVDQKDIDRVSTFFSAKSIFTIASYNVAYQGLDDIVAMFERLNDRYDKIWHGNFEHLVCVDEGKVASQFDVKNIMDNGAAQYKNLSGKFPSVQGVLA
ncbi:MAG: nuclear transport factor 2 family protein [Salinarimonas sp.]